VSFTGILTNEIIVYNRVLSSLERLGIEAYLRAKYNTP